ncbi:ApeA N-terminal domain 1-containing protein [Streptomyces sp. NPDC055099]
MANRRQQTTYVGEWWLPERPDQVLNGTLTVGPHYPELELYDRASSPAGGASEPFEPPVIHGLSMGTKLTLLTNVQTDAPAAGKGEHRVVHRRLIVGTVLIGGSHLREEAVRFNRASLRLTYLDEWVNRSPYNWEEGPPESLQVVDDLANLTASVPGCEIVLGRTWSSHFNRLADAGFSSHEVIELRLDERVPLNELEYLFVRPLEQLLTLAAGFHSKALDLQVGNDDGDVLAWELTAHSVRRRRPDQDQVERPVVRPHMRFGMNSNGYPPDIDFGDLVPIWFELQARLSGVCDLIFSLRSDTDGYLQQHLFTIASAVEGLHRGLNPQLEEKTADDRARNTAILEAVQENYPEHREWLRNVIGNAHRKSYAFRIQELLQEAGEVMVGVLGDQDKWFRKLRDVRNELGHVLSSKTTVDQMVGMLSSALLLAEAVLLRRLGFTEAECRRSLNYRWERENVGALVKKGFPEWFPDSVKTRAR